METLIGFIIFDFFSAHFPALDYKFNRIWTLLLSHWVIYLHGREKCVGGQGVVILSNLAHRTKSTLAQNRSLR